MSEPSERAHPSTAKILSFRPSTVDGTRAQADAAPSEPPQAVAASRAWREADLGAMLHLRNGRLPSTLDPHAAFAQVGFRTERPREGWCEASLPRGWRMDWEDFTDGADSLPCVRDAEGRRRVLVRRTVQPGRHAAVMLRRYMVSEVPGVPEEGTLRMAVTDAGRPVKVSAEFVVEDADGRTLATAGMQSWLDGVRPDNRDPLAYWDEPDIDAVDVRELAYAAVPSRATGDARLWDGVMPDGLSPSIAPFKALGFDFGASRVPGSLTYRMPSGWSADADGGFRDARGRLRASCAHAVQPDGSVRTHTRLLPRRAVAFVPWLDPLGRAMGTGTGRARMVALDTGRPIRASVEFDASDEAAARVEEGRVTRWLDAEHPGHADPMAAWDEA